MTTQDKNAVRRILDEAKASGRGALTAPEARGLCEAYGIAVPKEAVVTSASDAGRIDEDDLLTFFEQDENTQIICQHLEDLKDGRALCRGRQTRLEKEARGRPQGGPHEVRRACGELAHRRARRERQDLRRRVPPGGRDSRAHLARHARLRAWRTTPADAGYWHTIITPPMVFARLMVEVVEEMRGKGFV